MKQPLLAFLASTGGFLPFRLVHRRQALVLTYHRFSAGTVPDATSVRALTEQLDYLTARYRIVPLTWLIERLSDRRSLPAGLAAITVDDGYRDVYDIAFPLFRRFGVTATVFAVTGFIDGTCWIWTDKMRYVLARTPATYLDIELGGHRIAAALSSPSSRLAAAARINAALKTLPDAVKEGALGSLADRLAVAVPPAPPPELLPLTWPQAREMLAAGIEIGAHTVTHPVLTRVDDDQLWREVVESRARLEAMLSSQVDVFCYPNGGTNARVRDTVARAGYRGAVTTVPGFNAPGCDRLALRRIHTERDLPHFIQSTSGFEQLKHRLRARTPRVAAAL